MIFKKNCFYIEIRQSFFQFQIKIEKFNVKTILITNISSNKLSIFNLKKMYNDVIDDLQIVLINQNYCQLIKNIQRRDQFHMTLKTTQIQ